MKKLLVTSMILCAAGNSFAGCAEAYFKTSGQLTPEGLAKEAEISEGGFVVLNAVALGAVGVVAGPLAMAGGGAGLKAFYDKSGRLEFFGDLIQASKKYKRASFFRDVDPMDYIPQTQVGMAPLVNKTLYGRVERKVLKSMPNVTREDILRAIVRADDREDFCQSMNGEGSLKTSVKSFSQVVLKNL